MQAHDMQQPWIALFGKLLAVDSLHFSVWISLDGGCLQMYQVPFPAHAYNWVGNLIISIGEVKRRRVPTSKSIMY